MQEMALLFDFFIPVFFFFLGRCLKSSVRRGVVKESILVFAVALIFAPVVHIFTSLSVQLVFCAFLMMLQGIGICRICYKEKNPSENGRIF